MGRESFTTPTTALGYSDPMPWVDRAPAAVSSPPAAGAGSALARALCRVLVALVPLALGVLYVRHELVAEGRLGFPLDDSYIHLQFARNLASGHGWSFNPGEPTPGATSPLWVMLLAAVGALGIPFGPAAIGLGLACASAAAVLTLEVALAAGLPLSLATTAALALGTVGRFTWASVSGMEPCLAATMSLLLLWLALGARRGSVRMVTMGLVAGLGVLARPELFTLGLLVGLAETLRALLPSPDAERPLVGRLAPVALYGAAMAIVLAPQVVFCLATSGRPLPGTYYVKSVIYARVFPALLASRRAIYPAEMFLWMRRDNAATAFLFALGVPVWFVWRRRSHAWLVAAWPLVFWISAWISAPLHINLSRYTIPLLPVIAIVAMAPLVPLTRLRPGIVRVAVPVVLALLFVASSFRRQSDYQQRYLDNVDNILKMQVTMGGWVRGALPADARVATNDIGAITWYGGHPCIDTEGLVSVDLVTELLTRLGTRGFEQPDDILADYLQRRRADVVIVFPSWHRQLIRQPWLERIHEIDYPNNTGGDDTLAVYRVIRASGSSASRSSPTRLAE